MKGITINLDVEELIERIIDEVYAVVDDRIEEYIDENIDLIAHKVKEAEYSEKQAIQGQLIDADGLVELLEINKEEAKEIIGTVKERTERLGGIAISDKVPKSKVFSLLGIETDLPNFIL